MGTSGGGAGRGAREEGISPSRWSMILGTGYFVVLKMCLEYSTDASPNIKRQCV